MYANVKDPARALASIKDFISGFHGIENGFFTFNKIGYLKYPETQYGHFNTII